MPATLRLLRSPLVDLLVGPHGVDRYLELIRPDLTVHDARAQVIAVSHQTDRSVTVQLRPNAAWSGFRAGQFVRVGVEIDGVRHTRTYSPASSQHRDGGLELTVTLHPQGRVLDHLHSALGPGQTSSSRTCPGGVAFPRPRPARLVLISGGSGVTPVMSMLRTLCDERHEGEILFLHYARTAADWLYRSEVEELAARDRNLRFVYVATREGGRRLGAAAIRELAGDPNELSAAVCGPPRLIEAVRAAWGELGRPPESVIAETFTPPALTVTGAAADGTLRFLHSEHAAPIGDGTLLEQVEAAGLSPAFGCRWASATPAPAASPRAQSATS